MLYNLNNNIVRKVIVDLEKKIQIKIDLKKLPTVKKMDPKKEKIMTKILIDENRLALRFLEGKQK